MKSPRWIVPLGGFLGATALRLWMSTLDCRAAYYDPRVDTVHPENPGPGIYISWHENLLFPIHFRGHCNLTMLLSRHRDAEIFSLVAYHLGFGCVRGSTYRGATSAIRELLRKSRNLHLAITPDGPRGPRRQMAPGPIYLASKLGLPLVVIGFGYDRPWRMNSWDRFAIPKPYSRARAVFSPPITIPPNLDRAETENCRSRVERLLNRLTLEAEAWAESGTRKIEERSFHKQTVSLASWRKGKPDEDEPAQMAIPIMDRAEEHVTRRRAG